jgi:hypothetical protein
MILIQFSKFLAAAAAIALATLVIFMCFAIAVFGGLDLFYAGIGLLNLVVCGLTLRAVFIRRRNYWWAGLEFLLYGLVAVSARFVITDIALTTSGLLVLAGIITLVGSRFAPKPEPQRPYWD